MHRGHLSQIENGHRAAGPETLLELTRLTGRRATDIIEAAVTSAGSVADGLERALTEHIHTDLAGAFEGQVMDTLEGLSPEEVREGLDFTLDTDAHMFGAEAKTVSNAIADFRRLALAARSLNTDQFDALLQITEDLAESTAARSSTTGTQT